jgi:hypothetical protein
MLRRLMLTVMAGLMAVVAVVALPGAAFADVVGGQNTYGKYTCNASVAPDGKSAGWTCTVWDNECDDRGVYVGMKFYHGGNTDLSATGFIRKTDNAGGCGHSKTFSGTYYKPWGAKDITMVQTRLCRDEPHSTDTCFDSTKDFYY